MPMVNYHTARQAMPQDFRPGAMTDGSTFDTITLKHGITAIIGKPKKPGKKPDSTAIQSIRFDANIYSPDQAKAWLKKHNKKLDKFESAANIFILEIL